jgi:hypothetical protein
MKEKAQFVETPWGRMRVCPTCKCDDPRDNQWFPDQFDGRACQECKREADAASRIARGLAPKKKYTLRPPQLEPAHA